MHAVSNDVGQHYCAGFLLSPHTHEVLLIQKARPTWQAGRLNAVGGKIEPGETALAGMHREMLEETGLDIAPERWTERVVLLAPNRFQVHFFTAIVVSDERSRASSLTDEPVDWYPIHPLPANVLNNLHWLLPLAQDQEIRPPVWIPYI